MLRGESLKTIKFTSVLGPIPSLFSLPLIKKENRKKSEWVMDIGH